MAEHVGVRQHISGILDKAREGHSIFDSEPLGMGLEIGAEFTIPDQSERHIRQRAAEPRGGFKQEPDTFDLPGPTHHTHSTNPEARPGRRSG